MKHEAGSRGGIEQGWGVCIEQGWGVCTCVRVDPDDGGGGVGAQDALQRADGDAVVPAERDGNSPGRSLPAPTSHDTQ